MSAGLSMSILLRNPSGAAHLPLAVEAQEKRSSAKASQPLRSFGAPPLAGEA